LLYSGEPLATTSSSGSSQAKSDAIEFSGSSEKELDELYEKSRYVATKNENKLYKKLDLDGKREFMANFWRNRDSNKSTAVNEFMLEYLQRIAIAEAQFRSGNKEGWRTHRGRVYLTYGEPSEIERFPSSMGEKPYEIWYYHALEGGVQFIFIDLSGFGEYQLVHSTSRNEIQDYGWQSRWLFNQ
jgi:GWxTD domain-containing protein